MGILTGVLVTLMMTQAPPAVPPPAPVAPTPVVASTRSALVMPVRVGDQAPADVRAAAQAMEVSLADALVRHGGWKVLTRADIRAILDKAQQEQLLGCDAEACVAEVGEALGADVLLNTRVDVAGGTWNVQCSLVDARRAQVVRRSQVRARSMAAALASTDALARALVSTEASVTVDDPALPRRLGTDARGVEALKQELPRHGGDVVRAWTAAILAHNRESPVLSILQGSLLGGAGVVALMSAFIFGLGAGYAGNLYVVLDAERKAGAPPASPMLAVLLALVLPVPGLVVAAGLLVAAAALTAVDMMDRGRIRAHRKGCCRDEPAMQAAGGRRWHVVVATMLATVGALLASVAPCCFFITQLACQVPSVNFGLVFVRDPVLDPVVPMPLRLVHAVQLGFYALSFVAMAGLALFVGGPALAGALVMVRTGSEDVLDDEGGH